MYKIEVHRELRNVILSVFLGIGATSLGMSNAVADPEPIPEPLEDTKHEGTDGVFQKHDILPKRRD